MQVYPPETQFLKDNGYESCSFPDYGGFLFIDKGHDSPSTFNPPKHKKNIIKAFNFKTKKQYTGIIGFIMNLLGRNPEVM